MISECLARHRNMYSFVEKIVMYLGSQNIKLVDYYVKG